MEALLSPNGFNHPVLMARFGIRAIQSIQRFVQRAFTSETRLRTRMGRLLRAT